MSWMGPVWTVLSSTVVVVPRDALSVLLSAAARTLPLSSRACQPTPDRCRRLPPTTSCSACPTGGATETAPTIRKGTGS